VRLLEHRVADAELVVGAVLAAFMTATVMARLLSVNVGLPDDIAWQGQTVHTAVW
jgi:hypothetical protein